MRILRAILGVALAVGGLGCKASNSGPSGGGGDMAAGAPHDLTQPNASGDLAKSSSGDMTAATSGDMPATSGDMAVVTTGSCTLPPACDATPPPAGTAKGFSGSSPLGSANHRGRDQFIKDGDPQWVIANFEYGVAALEQGVGGEAVDIYLLRDCGTTWESLGTVTTDASAAHPSEEGVDDGKGRVYFQIPTAKALAIGRHRVHLVLEADLSTTELFLEVVPANQPIFVSDVDGTLTTSENAEFTALLSGSTPDANADAATALTTLAQKGYRPMYLTARPEWLVQQTRDFISQKGFPPGIIHTTLTETGATGTAAGTYKTAELALLVPKTLAIGYAFGNTNTDADAYNNASIMPLDDRIFYQYTDTAHGGRTINAYSEVLAEFAALPLVCK